MARMQTYFINSICGNSWENEQKINKYNSIVFVCLPKKGKFNVSYKRVII